MKDACQNKNAQFKAQEYASASSSKPYLLKNDMEGNQNDSEKEFDTETSKQRYDDSIIYN